MPRSNRPARATYGFLAGSAIACVDSVAFGGEVSPIVVVAMLLTATAVAGGVWGWRG